MRILHGREAALAAFRHRRGAQHDPSRRAAVQAILDEVRRGGDAALSDLGERYDGVRLERFAVDDHDRRAAAAGLDPELARGEDA
jgi:histidinol dehydrogenase